MSALSEAYKKFAADKPLDEDTRTFTLAFEEPVGKVLEVGAHDEPVANLLAGMGYDVTGMDLREYDPSLPPCNYRFVRGDFCDPPAWLYREVGTFDCVISLSALEHFGLDTYGENKTHEYYDIIASRNAWTFLKDGGVFYLTVPFGRVYWENAPHWRLYDYREVIRRLVQDFTIELLSVFVCGPGVFCNDVEIPVGVFLGSEHVDRLGGQPAHVSVLLKLRKVSPKRIAPDGR